MSETAAGMAQWATGLVLGALGGSFGTFVALRTRLAKTDRDIVDGASALARHVEDQASAITRLDKRQMVMLKLTVDIARKVGIESRQFDDALVRMLTDDS